MDVYRFLTILIAQWMRETNAEPTKGTAVKFSQILSSAFGKDAYQMDAQTAAYYGAAWQAVEFWLHSGGEADSALDQVFGQKG